MHVLHMVNITNSSISVVIGDHLKTSPAGFSLLYFFIILTLSKHLLYTIFDFDHSNTMYISQII